MRTVLTTAAELDALENFTPLRATIVGSSGTMTSEALAIRSPNGAWWITGYSSAYTTAGLLELANGGLTFLSDAPVEKVVERVVSTWERIDAKLDEWNCLCPDSYRDNNVTDGYCPQHDHTETVRELRNVIHQLENTVPPKPTADGQPRIAPVDVHVALARLRQLRASAPDTPSAVTAFEVVRDYLSGHREAPLVGLRNEFIYRLDTTAAAYRMAERHGTPVEDSWIGDQADLAVNSLAARGTRALTQEAVAEAILRAQNGATDQMIATWRSASDRSGVNTWKRAMEDAELFLEAIQAVRPAQV